MIHLESELLDSVFVQEELFLLQLKFSPQADPADEPNLHRVIQRQINLSGQFDHRQLALSQPAIVSLAAIRSAEIKFALRIH